MPRPTRCKRVLPGIRIERAGFCRRERDDRINFERENKVIRNRTLFPNNRLGQESKFVAAECPTEQASPYARDEARYNKVFRRLDQSSFVLSGSNHSPDPK